MAHTKRYFLTPQSESIKCYICNQRGHFASECTQERVKTCFLCGNTGHEGRECPAQICLNCMTPGHLSRECERPRRSQVACTSCGRLGHQRKDCVVDRLRLKPDPAAARVRCLNCLKWGHIDCTPAPSQRKPVFCYNCGQQGHQGHECRQPGMDMWQDRFTEAATRTIPLGHRFGGTPQPGGRGGGPNPGSGSGKGKGGKGKGRGKGQSRSPGAMCHTCGQTGHVAKFCPTRRDFDREAQIKGQKRKWDSQAGHSEDGPHQSPNIAPSKKRPKKQQGGMWR